MELKFILDHDSLKRGDGVLRGSAHDSNGRVEEQWNIKYVMCNGCFGA